jgi:ribosome-binding protein aMBF1 (putative translation factor)
MNGKNRAKTIREAREKQGISRRQMWQWIEYMDRIARRKKRGLK